jgi:serine/threonine protein kinase
MQSLLQSEIQVIIEMDHPNIIKFYQCVYDNNYVNIVMELVKGMNLADYIREKKRIPEYECQLILR